MQDDTKDTEVTESARAQRRPLMGSFTFLLVLVACVGAAFIAYKQIGGKFGPVGGQAGVSDNIEVLDTRLENLDRTLMLHERRIKELEDKQETADAQPAADSAEAASSEPEPSAAQADVSASADAATHEEIADANARIAELEAKLQRLSERTESARAQTSEESLNSIRIITAYSRLKDKILAGKPFAREMAVLRDSGTDEETERAIAALASYADTGAPTLSMLLSGFDDAVQQIQTEEATPPEDANFWGRFTHNMTHLVRVRRISAAETETSASAIIARAQAKLEREEIEAAIEEIKSLPETYRAKFDSWLEDAKNALAVPGILSRVEQRVLERAFRPSPNLQPHT